MALIIFESRTQPQKVVHQQELGKFDREFRKTFNVSLDNNIHDKQEKDSNKRWIDLLFHFEIDP